MKLTRRQLKKLVSKIISEAHYKSGPSGTDLTGTYKAMRNPKFKSDILDKIPDELRDDPESLVQFSDLLADAHPDPESIPGIEDFSGHKMSNIASHDFVSRGTTSEEYSTAAADIQQFAHIAIYQTKNLLGRAELINALKSDHDTEWGSPERKLHSWENFAYNLGKNLSIKGAQWKNWPDLALEKLVDAGKLGKLRDPYDSELYVHRV